MITMYSIHPGKYFESHYLNHDISIFIFSTSNIIIIIISVVTIDSFIIGIKTNMLLFLR